MLGPSPSQYSSISTESIDNNTLYDNHKVTTVSAPLSPLPIVLVCIIAGLIFIIYTILKIREFRRPYVQSVKNKHRGMLAKLLISIALVETRGIGLSAKFEDPRLERVFSGRKMGRVMVKKWTKGIELWEREEFVRSVILRQLEADLERGEIELRELPRAALTPPPPYSEY